jgi:hypothetical protein
MCTVICIHLHASVTPTWSINESVTTEEDVNIDDEIPKEKRKGRTKKRKIHKSRFVCYFLLEISKQVVIKNFFKSNISINSIDYV